MRCHSCLMNFIEDSVEEIDGFIICTECKKELVGLNQDLRLLKIMANARRVLYSCTLGSVSLSRQEYDQLLDMIPDNQLKLPEGHPFNKETKK